MGFGLAVSLLIDATVVRLVLLPAVLAILGDHTPGTCRAGSAGSRTSRSRAQSLSYPRSAITSPAARSPVSTAPFR